MGTSDVSKKMQTVTVYLVASYITWVLFGILAFVSHLGEQAPWLAPFLPATGQTMSGGSASTLSEFLRCNIPGALLFVLPHSLLRPQRLYAWFARIGLAAYDRLAYNLLAAISLHCFLCNFVGLRTPVVMWLPLPEVAHLCLSGGCLVFAAFCFVSNPRTATLLGVSRALQRPLQNLPRGMDAITWMALCVWERGGTVAFVLFTGVSILPPELTLGDAVTRGVAALYLRARSKAFCEWVRKVEGAHEATWIIRGAILLFVGIRAGATPGKLAQFFDWRLAAAAVLACSLRMAERWFHN